MMNDSLNNLFEGDTGEVRTSPVRSGAVEFKSAEQRFAENCPKCRGTGKFVSWGGRTTGQCFSCKGVGRIMFKTSPETRAAKRQQEANRDANRATETLAAFEATQPIVFAWLKANAQKFDFATKMVEAIIKYGSLTDGQLAACERLAAKDAARAAERTQQAASAPQVDTAGIDRLKAAFDSAVAYAAANRLTMKTPKIVVGGIKIYPAKADSKNPGAIYVKNGSTYLGKITGGQFFASRECDEATKTKVLAFVADPAKAAVAYGQTTGICCVCNATLISKWKHRGIGPICAKKMGWAGLAEDFGVDVK